MIIHVQFQDDHYDYVGPRILDKLFEGENVKRFFRPSEKRWVNVYDDPIRGEGGDHIGPNRRQHDKVA